MVVVRSKLLGGLASMVLQHCLLALSAAGK